MQIKFKDGNYSDTSAEYTIYYIIAPQDLTSARFAVMFPDGKPNDYTFDYNGAVRTPEMIVKDVDTNKVLKKDVDYDVYYSTKLIPTDGTLVNSNPLPRDPGHNYVYIKGKGTYTGLLYREYNIIADLSEEAGFAKIVTFKDDDTMVNGVSDQFLTGSKIIPTDFDVLLYRNDNTYIKLTRGTDYRVDSSEPNNNWTETGAPVATAYAMGEYYKNSISAGFKLVLDTDAIKISGSDSDTFKYTGYDIKPVYTTNYSNIVVDQITYEKDGTDPTNLVDIGSATATITLKLASTGEPIVDPDTNQTRVWTRKYRIVERPLSDPEVKIICGSKQRFTGEVITPAITVFIESEGNEPKRLVKNVDYTVGAATGVYGSGTISITATDQNKNLAGSGYKDYEIVLGQPVNLTIEENTGTAIKVSWLNDIYADGARLTLTKYDADGNTVSSKVFPENADYTTDSVMTISGLDGSTTYRLEAESVANYNNNLITSAATFMTFTTNISTTDNLTVEDKGNNKVQISWTDTGDISLYYIYRVEADGNGRLLAVIPKSTMSYTNTVKDKGTYTYYIEGYIIQNGQLVQVNKSEPQSVTVR
ncbi:MAG: hypothetical protein IKP29_05065, partial [Pseudobutyrivibrio sp.]|nr:hypothetical protein [Pseudobutyrivibrio sp.]